jgi:hypothetical protein
MNTGKIFPQCEKVLYMLLIFKEIRKVFKFFVAVIARLDRSPHSPQRTRLSAGATRRGKAIQSKQLDYPVKPYNDNHWNRVRHE